MNNLPLLLLVVVLCLYFPATYLCIQNTHTHEVKVKPINGQKVLVIAI